MRTSAAEKKQKREELTRLRQRRQSYLDKARECVVYGDAQGYYFWLDAANQVITQIERINWPDGPKTVRRVKAGEVLITLRKPVRGRNGF